MTRRINEFETFVEKVLETPGIATLVRGTVASAAGKGRIVLRFPVGGRTKGRYARN